MHHWDNDDNSKANTYEYLLCIRHCFKGFPYIKPFILVMVIHMSPILLWLVFQQWEKWAQGNSSCHTIGRNLKEVRFNGWQTASRTLFSTILHLANIERKTKYLYMTACYKTECIMIYSHFFNLGYLIRSHEIKTLKITSLLHVYL